MIVCEEALIDGIPKQLKDWDKIHVSLEDAAKLATNGLPINGRSLYYRQRIYMDWRATSEERYHRRIC